MADDRPANDDLTAVVADMKRELEDLRSTTLARMSRSATGTVEQTLRTSPLPDTLFLQGQTLNRADYPVLWQWVLDQGLSPSVFGAGNGTSTFVLPDFRGRTPVGATAARPPGTVFGSATSTLAIANLPAHDHGGTGSTSQVHTHPFSTDYASTSHSHTLYVDGVGDHNHGSHGHQNNLPTSPGGANPVGAVVTGGAAVAGGGGHSHSGRANVTEFGHDHSGATGAGALGNHAHTIPSQGGGTPVNTEDPGVSVNWLIYC